MPRPIGGEPAATWMTYIASLEARVAELKAERDRFRAESINQQDWLIEWNKSKARVAELEARLERAKESVELHDFFTTYDILHEPITN